MKKTLELSFIMVGTIIGAGFASGQEVYQYFARFGVWSILFALLAGLLFFISYKFLLNLSRREQFEDYNAFSRKTFGNFSPLFDVFLCFSFIVLCGSMYASLNQLQGMLFDINFPILSLITAVLCVLTSLKGFSGLAKASIFTVPPIVVAILVLSFSKTSVENISYDFLSGVEGCWSCVIYVAMNVLLSGVFLVLVGKKYSKKQIKISSIVSIGIITVLLISICLCLIANPRLKDSQVPLLTLSFALSKPFGYVFCAVVWCAVFSTLISSSFTCINIISSKNQFLSSFIVVLAGYLLSNVGFGNIVRLVYPVVGVVGIVFMMVVFIRFGKRKALTNKL